MNVCSQHLKSTLDAFKTLDAMQHEGKIGGDRRFFNNSDLILTLGEEFDGQPLPPGVAFRGNQACYENTRLLCESVDWALDYYEGYGINLAMPMFPIAHAWAVDPLDGTILDTTWEQPEGYAYIGVRIDRDVVYEQMERTGYNSVFESDWMASNYMLLEGWKELSCVKELEEAP